MTSGSFWYDGKEWQVPSGMNQVQALRMVQASRGEQVAYDPAEGEGYYGDLSPQDYNRARISQAARDASIGAITGGVGGAARITKYLPALAAGAGFIADYLTPFGDDSESQAPVPYNPSINAGGSSMAIQQYQSQGDIPGLMDAWQYITELFPGGPDTGQGRAVRAVEGVTRGQVVSITSVKWKTGGGWMGSYITSPSARKRGFFVSDSGMVKTWAYQRMTVISKNPRAGTLAKAADRVNKLASGLVRAKDRTESGPAKRLKKRKR